MIVLENVTKIYKTGRVINKVISDVSAILPSGVNVGILGRNGAGKSTLLRMMGGIELPTRGQIQIHGTISWPVGLSSGLKASLSAKQNVLFVCQIYGCDMDETKRIINYVRDFCELGLHFDLPMNTYSSGMGARVNFALSMAFDFDYYLVDEVTGVGDPKFRNRAKEAFDAKSQNSTMIMVSHDMPTIRQNCDVCILINKGKIEFYDDIDYAIRLYEKL